LRTLILDTYYPGVLKRHYATNPELRVASYGAQLAALMELRFGTSDAYSEGLARVGVEAAELIINCPELQASWDREHGGRGGATRNAVARFAGSAPSWLRDEISRRYDVRTAAAQIEAFAPDVLYLQALHALPTDELRRQRANGRFVVGQIASTLPDPRVVAGFDLVLTSFPHYVERVRDLGVDAEYFPIAFDERVLGGLEENGIDAAAGTPRPHGATFVGGVNPGVHGRGTAFLEQLAERVRLSVWGYGADSLRSASPLRAVHHGEAWGVDMYEVLGQSRIAINRHIEAAEGYSNNMRLFEASGVGALLCTEESPNLGELFTPGREVIAYTSVDDLADKITYYLEHDEERVEIAAAGQRRTLSEHTYARRMADLAGMLEARL